MRGVVPAMAREIAEEETGKPATLAVQMFPKIHVMVPLAAVVSPVNNFGFEKMVRLAREGVVEEINVPSFFWGGGLLICMCTTEMPQFPIWCPFDEGEVPSWPNLYRFI